MDRSNRRFHTFDSGTHEWIGTEDENKGGELEGTSYSKNARKTKLNYARQPWTKP